MRTQSLLIIGAALGLVVACAPADERREWGYAYQPETPGIDTLDDDDDADDDSDDDDAPTDDDDDNEPPPEDDEDTPPPEDDGQDETGTTGGITTSPITDPDITAGGEESSTGIPDDTLPPESPYQGGWDIGACQDEADGSIADFQLTDAFGDTVRLYDFCHKAVLLTAGSFW